MKVLLDENLDQAANGDGFEVLLTGDKTLSYDQEHNQSTFGDFGALINRVASH